MQVNPLKPEDAHEMTLDEFKAHVAAMREVGAIQWGDIILGPPPPVVGASPEADVNTEEASLSTRRKHYEDVFGRTVGDEELKRLP